MYGKKLRKNPSKPMAAKPNPKMLGTGAAAKAGKTVQDAQKKKQNRLKSVMQGLRRGREYSR